MALCLGPARRSAPPREPTPSTWQNVEKQSQQVSAAQGTISDYISAGGGRGALWAFISCALSRSTEPNALPATDIPSLLQSNSPTAYLHHGETCQMSQDRHLRNIACEFVIPRNGYNGNQVQQNRTFNVVCIEVWEREDKNLINSERDKWKSRCSLSCNICQLSHFVLASLSTNVHVGCNRIPLVGGIDVHPVKNFHDIFESFPV